MVIIMLGVKYIQKESDGVWRVVHSTWDKIKPYGKDHKIKEIKYDGYIDDLTRLELDDIPDPQIQIDSNLQLNMPTYK